MTYLAVLVSCPSLDPEVNSGFPTSSAPPVPSQCSPVTGGGDFDERFRLLCLYETVLDLGAVVGGLVGGRTSAKYSGVQSVRIPGLYGSPARMVSRHLAQSPDLRSVSA